MSSKQELAKLVKDLAELVHEYNLAGATPVIERKISEAIFPIILKGSALAYTHYPSPSLRTRCDTDLLINLASRENTNEILKKLGYKKAHGLEGETVSNEAAYLRRDEIGFIHTFDLHWQINNAQLFARLFSYEDLISRARPISELDERAIGLCDTDALLLACLHRAGHLGYTTHIGDKEYSEGNRIVWLYDTHLLFTRMSSEEKQAFATRALELGLAGTCLDALETCSSVLETPVPNSIREALRSAGQSELASRYLHASRFERGWIEFQSVTGWGRKWRYIRENLFPPAEYMRQKYPHAKSRGTLPILYLKRAVGGIKKRVLSTRVLPDR